MRLRKSGHYASRLSVAVRYLDGSHWDADMRLVDTQDTMTFLHALEKLWAGRPRDRRTILQVGMAFGDLVTEAGHTGSLFASESKSKSLYETLDKLNARFGRQAVYFASAHKAREPRRDAHRLQPHTGSGNREVAGWRVRRAKGAGTRMNADQDDG